jgi:uncharacterized protein YecT (DUF1311 family)
MNIYGIKISFLTIIILTFTFAEQKAEPECDYNQVDKKLNTIYNSILSQYKDYTLFINRFKEAQRAWLKYRDAHLESRFPTKIKGNQYSEYGSIYPQCACIELKELTEERIKILEKWLDGTVEGDVCSGSYKTK